MNQTEKPGNLLQSGVSDILPKDFLGGFISRFNGFKGEKNLKINLFTFSVITYGYIG